MLSRREFLRIGLAGAAGAMGSCARFNRPSGPPPEQFSLRTITYNIYNGVGWSRTKELAGEMDEAESRKHYLAMARRYAEALSPYRPDIITIQEAPAEWVVAQLASNLGMKYAYFSSPAKWPGALLTRLPMVRADNCPLPNGRARSKGLFTYHWGRAVLDSPHGELIVHSCHLHAYSAFTRKNEMDEVLRVVRADLRSGRPLLLQGDLNHTPYGTEYRRWKRVGLVDTSDVAGRGSDNTIPADMFIARFDYIWADSALARRTIDARVLAGGLFATELPDPTSPALSDHVPMMATFNGPHSFNSVHSKRNGEN